MELVTKTRLQERGQVTIPFRVRSLLHLKPGEELILLAMENEIILKAEVKQPTEKAGMLGKDNETKTVKGLVARYKGY